MVCNVRSWVDGAVQMSFVSAARAVIEVGGSVSRRGNGVNRHCGGGVQECLGTLPGSGGQGIVISVMLFSGMNTRGPSNETKLDSASRPRSYRSCAAGGRVGWRYHASSKIA
jgi:hypothetical protein